MKRSEDKGLRLPAALAVVALALAWTAHAAWDARHRSSGRDPATIRNRERRGF